MDASWNDDAVSGDIRVTFARLAHVFRDGRSTEEICQVVARAATDVIPGCDHAGVAVLSSNGTFTTLNATDKVVEIADRLQR